MILYNTYESMNKDLHNSYYLKDSSTGIYYLKNDMTNLGDTFYKGINIKDFPYFILENIHIKDKLYQQITEMKNSNTYIRLGKKSATDVGDFNKSFTENGYDFTEWYLENFKETNKEVIDILDTSSKVTVDKKLLRKNDVVLNDLFKYIGKLQFNDINNINNATGFYSVYWTKALFDSTFYPMHLNKTHYASIRNETATMGEGVMEIYNEDKYILQIFYSSRPQAIISSRYYDKEAKLWQEWRVLQTLVDLAPTTLHSPYSYLSFQPLYPNINYHIPPFNAKNASSFQYKPFYFGYMSNNVLLAEVNTWKLNPGNSPNVKFSYTWSFTPYYPIFWTFGYMGDNTPINLEAGWNDKILEPYGDPTNHGVFSYRLQQGDKYDGIKRFPKSTDFLNYMGVNSATWTTGFGERQLREVILHDLLVNVDRQGEMYTNVYLDSYNTPTGPKFSQSKVPYQRRSTYAADSPGGISYINGFKLYWDTNALMSQINYKKTVSSVGIQEY